MENNWRCGYYKIHRIYCRNETSKGVYCLQYDDYKIISGLRDNTIKIWDRNSLQCSNILTGHTGSVLCLQYDERIIISGSVDATVRVWNVNSCQMVNTLIHHTKAVLHLKFHNEILITCSKDKSIAVWNMTSPTNINLRCVLVEHRAPVNVVDFDEKYIISGSGNQIKVWNTSNCVSIRTLVGHKRGITCLQYRDPLVVSGSYDKTIKLWDIECGTCLRVLEGHEEVVRSICFDEKPIVSGSYDGEIKVWDLKSALDPLLPNAILCLRTLAEHTGKVFGLQFDEFHIVSSSSDDTILIWDFLSAEHTQSNCYIELDFYQSSIEINARALEYLKIEFDEMTNLSDVSSVNERFYNIFGEYANKLKLKINELKSLIFNESMENMVDKSEYLHFSETNIEFGNFRCISISEDECCLYTAVSHSLVGSKNLKYFLRLLTVLEIIKYYTKYKTAKYLEKLNEENSETFELGFIAQIISYLNQNVKDDSTALIYMMSGVLERPIFLYGRYPDGRAQAFYYSIECYGKEPVCLLSENNRQFRCLLPTIEDITNNTRLSVFGRPSDEDQNNELERILQSSPPRRLVNDSDNMYNIVDF